ncbi:GTP-binding protein Der [compost metagenome]
MEKTDLALLVVDAEEGLSDFDVSLAAYLRQKKIPSLGVLNKIDLEAGTEPLQKEMREKLELPVYAVSASNGKGINELRKAMGEAVPDDEDKFKIVGDLVRPGDFVVLVTPIDKAAPKGRLILPQQQTIRDILEADAIAVVTKEYELKETLERLGTKPALVITDSQAFLKVAADTPKDVPLTSFSILFARHKGDLAELVSGARALEKLQDGDKILVAEACTHHQQSDDIGRVKIPRWIRQNTGKELHFDFASGYTFPGNITDYALIVHCGSCMLNRRSMLHRIAQAVDAGVPIVNYGVLIAYVQGIFPRAIEMFPLAKLEWDEA